MHIARGASLLYRRNKANGTSVAKVSDGQGAYWTTIYAKGFGFSQSGVRRLRDAAGSGDGDR
ncbi:hypothetical protein AC629_22925 [Bradyrhizobium sp. NAS80.1]|uniref:hypothetical protein n=1 Tax=Bradyrhizobium sp. NAS80.1 TaxID=1680159 RepID=UPI00095E90C8|nr:hypothetical protein [Bradyrhizobium sp. NAS80.1]OKO83157.1 hypothetical protein AC629_22925 [Bradyrhizobium sp. NAS80.1]